LDHKHLNWLYKPEMKKKQKENKKRLKNQIEDLILMFG